MELSSRLARLLVVGLVALTSLTEGRWQDFVAKDVDLEGRKLSDNVTPVEYFLEFDLRKASLSQPLPDVYSGYASIKVKFTGRPKSDKAGLLNQLGACVGAVKDCIDHPYREILLHADESVKIEKVEVYVDDEWIKVDKMRHDRKRQLIYLKLGEKLPHGDVNGLIMLQFSGKVRRDYKGIYLGSEQVGSKAYPHIAANFEPNFARLAMPCFDEPRFRAKVDLKLMHSQTVWSAADTRLVFRSPTDAHNVQSVFAPTPSIPLHKMSFVIGSFQRPDGPTGALPTVKTSKDVVLRYLSLPGASHRGRELLDIAQKAFVWMQACTQSRMQLYKLDIVPTTDASIDRTAAWGLVYYRDAPTMTVRPLETVLGIAELVAEQWFGVMVGVSNPDDLWLTDAIAAQLALNFVAETYPEYKSQIDSDKLDEPQNSRVKFAKYLRSMKPEEFQSAVRSVVAKYSYKNIELPEIFAAFINPN